MNAPPWPDRPPRYVLLWLLLLFAFSPLPAQDPIRIMPLGNSITYGNYHPEYRPEGLITGYRQSLWLLLQEAGYEVDFVGSRTTGADAEPDFDPHNEGYPGWRDDQIRDNVFNWLSNNPADVVILHIGTNGLDPDPSDVEEILEEIDRYENTFGRSVQVILAKIINRSTYSQLTTQFNQNIEKMALDRVKNQGDAIVVIDMEFETGIDYRLTTSGGEMYDNLHPFVGGHQKMAVRWFDALQRVLPRPDGKPFITSECPSFAHVGILFSHRVTSQGDPVPSFRLAQSPEEMAIDPESGEISWTPSSDGTYEAMIIAENVAGKDTQMVSFTVNDPGNRVMDGLVALYDFRETGGNLVHDVSGVGQALDLYINYEGNVNWDSVQGLEVSRDAILVPSDMNRKIADSCMSSGAITLEAWIRTGYKEQGGPAHLISISDSKGTGITLSQEFSYMDTSRFFFTRNLRTSSSAEDGSPPLSTDTSFGSIGLQHLVYSRHSDGTERFYINGEPAGSGLREGDFSIWNGHSFKLSLFNSLDFEHPWVGKIFLAAVYNRALPPSEVLRNFQEGPGKQTGSHSLPAPPADLEATPLSAVAARLTWEDRSTDETGFIIQRKGPDGRYHYVASAACNTTEYTDPVLMANRVYHYRVKALNNRGESAWSNEAAVRTFTDNSLTNVALYKSATQSSTIYGGDAARAVDGNTSGEYYNQSVTHTDYELNAWWEVDLGAVYNINYIEVWNRTDDCCKDRMARFNVFVSEEPFESKDFQSTLDQAGVWSVYEDRYPEPMVRFNVARKGRYIRLQLSDSQEICLAELVAMGNNHLGTPQFYTTPSAYGTQDLPYTYSFGASDPDNDSLVYRVARKPSWLVFNPETRSIGGTPENADTGRHSVELTVYDGLYLVEQSFQIEVENVNDPPAFTSTPVTGINQDETYLYQVEVSDPDNDPVIFQNVQVPGWLVVNDSLLRLEGVPANEDVGIHDIYLTVTDGLEAIEQHFQLVVYNLNDEPCFTTLPPTEVYQDEEYAYQPATADPDRDTLLISAVQLPDWLEVTGDPLIVRGIPGNTQVGVHRVVLQVTDGTDTVEQRFDLTVINVNDPPRLDSIPDWTIPEDEVLVQPIEADDPDGDTLIFSFSGLPPWLGYDTLNHELSGVPENSDVGEYFIVATACDGVLIDSLQFIITVLNVPDPPVFISLPELQVWEDEAYGYMPVAEDVDGDSLVFYIVEMPGWMSFDETTGQLSGLPVNGDVGMHQIALMVTDGTDSVVQEYQLIVENSNDPPWFESSPPQRVRPGEHYHYRILAYDMDQGDTLQFAFSDPVSWLTLHISSDSTYLEGTPLREDAGIHPVSITISDGTVEVVQQFNLEVLDITGLNNSAAGVRRIYPNPARDLVRMELTGKCDGTVRLFDLTGELKLELIFRQQQLIDLDMSGLDASLYLYHVETAGGRFSGKIIKF